MNKKDIKKRLRELDDDYFFNAFSEIELIRNQSNEDLEVYITQLFIETLDRIEDRLAVFYTKYGSNKLNENLTKSDFRMFMNRVKSYVEEAEDKDLTLDKDVVNSVTNITHISQFNSIRYELIILVSLLLQEIALSLDSHFGEQYVHTAILTAYTIFDVIGYGIELDESQEWNKVEDALRDTWRADGATSNEMVWRYQRWLGLDIGKNLFSSIINSDDFAALVLIMSKLLDSTRRKIARIIRTDSSYMGNRASKDMFEFIGVDHVVFTAILDDRTSEMCQEADGNIIDVDEIEYGWNAPPLHEYCRSFLVPYINSENIPDYVDGFDDEDLIERSNFREQYLKERGLK